MCLNKTTNKAFVVNLMILLMGVLIISCDQCNTEDDGDDLYFVQSDLGTIEEDWREVNTGLPGEEGVYPTPLSFAFTGDNEVFMGTDGFGVFYSSDGGESWQGTPAAISASMIYDLLWKDGKLFAATDAGIIVTEDNGATWDDSDTGISEESPAVYSIIYGGEHFPDLYACAGMNVYISSNNGDSWDSFSNGLPADAYVRCVYPHLGMLLVGLAGSTEAIIRSPVYKRSTSDVQWVATLNHISMPGPSEVTYVEVSSLLSIGGDALASYTSHDDSEDLDMRIIQYYLFELDFVPTYKWHKYHHVLNEYETYNDSNIILTKGGVNGAFLANSFRTRVQLSVYTYEANNLNVHDTHPTLTGQPMPVTALDACNGIDDDWYTTYFAGLRDRGVRKRGHVYNQ